VSGKFDNKIREQEWEKHMQHNKINKCALAVKLGLLVGSAVLTMPALAQEEVAKEEQVEVIEIRGIRASQEANLNAKRFSNAVVDVVTAEDIGKFPDKNVAESLSRITGVGVSREFGEGEKITVRGASSSTNRTLLNGQTVATADWFILDNPGRSFNYTMLPSALVSDLEVYKSPLASIDEGSIGGTVILRTRKPLSMEANSINISLEGQYSESSEKWDPQVSGMYSWKNDAESFGVLVSAIKQDRKVVREGIEVLGWPTNPALDEKVPSHIGVPRFEQDRERETLFLSLQARPNDNLDMVLNVLDSKVDANNQNQNWLIFVNNNAASLTNTVIEDGSVVAGEVASGGTAAYNFINRVSSTETRSIDFDLNYSAESFELHTQVGHTKAKGGTYRETSWEYGTPADLTGYTFDLRGGTPSASTTIDASDPTQFRPGWIWGGEKPTTDEETYAQFDFNIPVQKGAFTAVKTGAKYRMAERTQDRVAYSWHGPQTMTGNEDVAGSYLDHIFATCYDWAQCGLFNGTVNIDAVVNGNMTQQLAHNRAAMEQIAFVGLDGVPADFAKSLNLPEIWSVEEDILALYVQGDFEGEGFRGNIGVRYVDTQQTSGGYEFSGDSWGLLTYDREWLTPEYLAWVETDNDYAEVLPSLNIAFDLSEEQILRFGAARVMARQDWNNISSSITYGSLDVAQPTGSASNPHLMPQIADQFDLSWEWYFDASSLLAVTYFHKDVKSYRSFSTFVDERYWEEGEEWVDVTFTRPENGPGGKTDGFEVSYQQAFGDFGVSANYTYTNAERDEARDLTKPGSGLVEGTSRHMANASVYYETDKISARLMYNYRTEWYKGLHYNGDELWNDSYGQLDASIGYNLTDNITLSFEAVNLTNEEVVEFNTDKARLFSIYENGRRFVAGVRMNF
jgi:iron complex outermembrane receptor protein|tara:strand:+ start:296 stop:3025 length:2730 start_codon:yes stop_codon:yes gene_type:complete